MVRLIAYGIVLAVYLSGCATTRTVREEVVVAPTLLDKCPWPEILFEPGVSQYLTTVDVLRHHERCQYYYGSMQCAVRIRVWSDTKRDVVCGARLDEGGK